MSIIRSEKNRDYTVISNVIFKDSSISARAKGIFAYIMTLPDDWKLYKSELARHFSEGTNAIDTAFKELETCGYIHKTRTKGENGAFTGWDYTVHEHPKTDHMENLKSEFRPVGNQSLPSTNVPSTKKQVNTNENKRFDPSFDALNGQMPLSLKTDDFKAAWDTWCRHRKQKRDALTEETVKLQLASLEKDGVDGAVAKIMNAIEKGWKGLYPIPTSHKTKVNTGEPAPGGRGFGT